MKVTTMYKQLAVALVLVTGSMLWGCGSDSTTTTPGNTNIFFASGMTFRNNSTVAWGYNGFGQFGDGTTTSHTDPRATSLVGVRGVALGAYHSIAFGTYSAWTAGGNASGQLGRITSATQDAIFQPVNFQLYSTSAGKPASSPWHKRIIAAVAGGTHNLLLNESGEVWSWGGNGSGQLGNGSFSGATNGAIGIFPVRDFAGNILSLGTLTTLEQSLLAAGTYHSLALAKGTASIFAWGYNNHGQLGIPGFDSLSRAQQINFPGLTASSFVKVAAGGSMSAALDSDGKVWVWGLQGDGRPDIKTPQQVAGLTGVTDISVGSAHMLALKGDGSVWAWGFNGFGQLGIGSKADAFTPQQVTGISGATAIRAFGTHSFARVGSGSWYAWGDNGQGQLGVSTGSLTYALTPVVVPGL